MADGPRPLVARPDGRRRRPTARPSRGQRAPALPALHLGHDGQAQGHHAHHRRLPRPRWRSRHKYVFDLHPETDVYWCAADIGWVTGHSYIVYGPLAQRRARRVIYEGTPDTPATRAPPGPRGQLAQGSALGHHRALQGHAALHRAHRHPHVHEVGRASEPDRHDLSSLRVLGTVGEPINPEAWMWYHAHIGGERCPDRRHVVADRDRRPHDHAAARRHDHQARLGDAADPRRVRRARRRRRQAGRARRRLPHAHPAVAGACCAASGATPSATARPTGRRFEGRYFAGDGAKLDDDGYLWLLGRVDDVMNVSGHRISTTEVESALVDHPAGRRGGRRRRQRRRSPARRSSAT